MVGATRLVIGGCLDDIKVWQILYLLVSFRVLFWKEASKKERSSKSSDVTKQYQDFIRKIEDLGGQRVGRHRVFTALLVRKKIADAYTAQRMYMIRLPDSNEMAYTVLVNEKKTSSKTPASKGLGGARDECIVLECGTDGAAMLDKLGIYESKLDGQFEGSQYTLGDFVVSANMFKNPSRAPKGITIEIQYTPSDNMERVGVLLDEFQHMLGGSPDALVPVIPNFSSVADRAHLPSEYCMKHTALQYVAAFDGLL